MKKIFLFAAAALMLLACSKEDAVPEGTLQQDPEGTQTFYAKAEGTPDAGTKVYADYKLRVLWNADDRITVFNQSTLNKTYKFMGNEGDTAGDFDFESSVTPPAAPSSLSDNYALYPSSEDAIINDAGTQITADLPEVQKYEENSFGIGANTMVAVCDGDDNHLSFKNVCGYLKLRLYGAGIIKSITLEGNNNEKIAGKAHISVSMDDDPAVLMDNTASNAITMNFADPVALGASSDDAASFIFVIPPTTFSQGFKITVTDAGGAVYEKTTNGSIQIKRNTLETMNPLNVEFPAIEYEDYADLGYDTFYYVDTDLMQFVGRPGSIDEIMDATTSKLQKDRNRDNYYKLVLYDGAASIEFIKIGTRTSINKYPGYNDNLTQQSLYLVSTATVGGHTYQIILRPDFNCITIEPASSQMISDGDIISIQAYLKKDGELYPNGYNTYQDLVVNGASGVIRFDDDNFKTYCVANFDTDGDREISAAEAAVPTSIDVSSKEITSLKGIEHFVNLTTLYCGGNQLTSLNIRNLRALSDLNCNQNQLTSLDVSHNTALGFLACSGNQLSSIDLSQNTLLTGLNIENNQLSSLDLSGNPAVENVFCANNQLTSLILQGCTALQRLQCGNNQLTSIDLSSSLNIGVLDCGQNQLTSLDVTGCTNLFQLVCSFNQLTSIDVSHNPLTQLYVQSNQLTSLSLSSAAQPDLYWLRCGNNNISSLDLSHFNSLKRVYCENNPSLTSVSCTYCPDLITCDVTDNTALKSLALSTTKLESITGLKTCTALETLICQSSKVSTLDVSDMTSLKQLRVAWNQMTSLNVSGCTALKELVCRQNHLTSLDVSTNTAIETLECQNNSLSSLDVTSNTALKELWCFKNSLQTLNLTYNRYLEILRCNDNQLTSVNLQYLGNQIHLTEMYIHNNSLSSLNLTKLTALEKLYCDNNQLSSLSLVNNTSLTELAAWASGQTGSIRSLTIALGMNITYLGADHSTVIDPTGDPWNTLIFAQGSM